MGRTDHVGGAFSAGCTGRHCENRVEAEGCGTVVRKDIDIPLGLTVNLPLTLAAGSRR